jgi:hypothetical protein
MKALDMTKQEGGVHDLTTKRREAMQKIGQSFPSHGYVENPNYSGIMTPTVESRSPRESFAYGQEGARQIPKPIPISAEVRAKKVQRQPGAISKVAGAIAESSPVRMGLAGYGAMYNAQDAWQNRNNDPAGSMMSGAGALGDIASLAPLATKWGARLAPTGAALSSAADTARRLKQNDYIGAVTSGLGAIAPYAAPFVFGPQVGIPVGIATALGAPIANEIKDSQMMERVMEYLDGLRRNQGR